MSEQISHTNENGDLLPDWLTSLRQHVDLRVPDGYFEASSDGLKALGRMAPETPPPGEYFDDRALLLKSLRHLPSSERPDLHTPDGYFEQSAARIKSKIKRVHKPGRVLRLVLGPAVAAAAVVAAVIWWKPENQNQDFEAMLASADLSEAHLEYFAEEEDYYTLWLMEDELEVAADTVVTDTLTTDGTQDLQVVQHTDSLAITDTLTTKPHLNKEKKKTISFDDLSDEDIMNYFLEEGSDGLFDE